MRLFLSLTCSGLLAAVSTQHSAAAPRSAPLPLKVMSFNIRYGTANDGANAWPQRQQLVLETIRVSDPDLLGLQEVQDFQAAFLKENLPNYVFIGVGRDDGVAKGEFAPVMIKKDRLVLEDSGQFWLSETPNVPGSKSWDAALPRLLTWAVLRDRRANSDPFIFANTHWDHRGAEARLQSARLIRQRAEQVAGGYPCILAGDFNSTEDDPPYAVLVRAEGFSSARCLDSYRVIHPDRTSREATFHGWTGRREGKRIDWIIHTPEFTSLNAYISCHNDDGRYPSDHYPVEAVLRLQRTPR